MSNFKYRGRSGRGETITGRLDAESVDSAAARLLNLGITPLDIVPDGVESTSVNDLLQRLGAGRPSSADLVLFARQMFSITCRIGPVSATERSVPTARITEKTFL